MASVSSTGIGSGLDVSSIIKQLMTIEQKPLDLLKTKADGISAKISAFGQVTAAVEAFNKATVTLAGLGSWNAMSGSSSASNTVAVSTGVGASVGNYAVAVQQLAKAQSVSSSSFATATSSVGTGTLKIDIGSWADGTPPTFTAANGNTTLSVDVTAADTLTTLRDKINALGKGVNASILNDASGARLVINSRDTGVGKGFRLSTSGDGDGSDSDATGLSALAYDPQNSAGGMTLRQAGGDAAATVNGLPVTSASNTLANVVEGVTLTLGAVTSAPVSIGVSADTERIRKSLDDFVTAYNDLAKLLSKQTKYDAETKTAGTLQGESTAVTLQRQLRNMLGASTPASSVYQTLSTVGVAMQSDGTLAVDDGKWKNAISTNLGEVRKLFTATDLQNSSRSGIATQLRKFSDSVLSVQGLLTTRTEGLNDSLSLNDNEQKKMQTRLSDTETRLRAQYSALDTKMSSLTALNAYVTQQITTWNKNNN